MSEEYTNAVQRLVERYASTIGQVAYGIARKDEHVSLDDDEVEGFDGGIEELDALISSYEEVIGEVAVTIARQVLADRDVEVPARVEA